MDVKIISDEKDVLDVEVSSLTVVELLRSYLNLQDVRVAAWSRDHPTKNPVLHIEADNPRKELKKAFSQVEKELDSFVDAVKKIK